MVVGHMKRADCIHLLPVPSSVMGSLNSRVPFSDTFTAATDVIVNKSAKNFLQQQFQKWYAEQICEHAAPREAQCCFSGFTIECREATGSTVDD